MPPDDGPALIDAKFHPPAVYARTIARRALLERLAGEPRVPIVTVIAPPGYGKTELLSQLASTDTPSTWLTLDDLDNEPSVLVRSLAAAIERLGPRDAATLEAVGPRRMTVAGLAHALHAAGPHALLVLDDLQRVTSRGSLDVLVGILEHLPAGARVALGSRTVPDLPLGRYRARGALLELDRADLALDGAEARELAAGVGVRLDGAQAEALVARTEGWAAAIYLAALARGREHRGVDAPIAVSGDDAYIADYLRSELVASFPYDALSFLAKTSIVDVVEPALADAIVGQPGSAEMLEMLARSSQLVSRLGTGRAYRYHHLLRSYLLAEVEARQPGATLDLHLRAAAWYEAAGRPEAAMEHALAGGDLEGGVRIVSRVFLRIYYGGHGDQLERWLGGYSEDDLRRHPGLAVLAGWLFTLGGKPEAAERVADIADRACPDSPTVDGTASLASARAMLRALMARRGVDALRADATFAVDAEGPGSPWRFIALYGKAASLLLDGDVAHADELLRDIVAVANDSGFVPFYGLALRSSLAMAQGDWAAAGALARESHHELDRTVLARMATTIHVHAVCARVAMHEGDLRTARQELVHAQLARPNASYAAPWTSVLALMELARAYLAISDPSGARTVLAEAEAIVRRRPQLGVLVSQLEELRRRVADARSTFVGSSALTAAEMRLLPNLSTPYTFKEIGDRLFLSQHTVKTQAISIYGKLDASTRSEAIERAIEIGLLEPFPGVPGRQRSEG